MWSIKFCQWWNINEEPYLLKELRLLIAIIYSILWIIVAIRFADRDWKIYYPTLLFAALSNVLYELICYKNQLWQMEPNGLPIAMIPILLLCLIGMPLSTWVFLSNYPQNGKFLPKVYYILFFAAIFIVLEYIAVKYGSITYHNGWNLLWSTFFDIVMFIIVRVHFRNPIAGLCLSVLYTGLLMVIFHVSFDKMK